MKRIVSASASLALLTGLILIPARSAATQGPPRYALEVGQELVYEDSSQFKGMFTFLETNKTTFWVVRTNGDGSWHIIAHKESTSSSNFGNAGMKMSSDPTLEALDTFDLHPDGRIANPPQGKHLEKSLPGTFIRLPADIASAQAGWNHQQADGDLSVFRLSSQSDPASGKWIFEGVLKQVDDATSRSLIHFDAQRGLITRVESKRTGSDWGSGGGRGKGILELKSATKKTPEWITQLTQETDILSKAKAATRDACQAVRQGHSQEQATATGEKALRDGRSKVKMPMMVAQFGAQLRDFTNSVKWSAEARKSEEAVLNKPAADWTTVDIDGKQHSLAGYRGKVMVLDFWYRGCSWCIKAMPQIKQVAEHYQGKPVVVLGMNTDHDEKDARFIVDKLKLNYATLKAEGLPEKYSVQGFPTLIIIDQEGIVRERHVSYSPTLRDALIKKIDALLASKR